MPEVNVTEDSLIKVKDTLRQFKIEIENVPHSMIRNTEMAQAECEQKIKELEGMIYGLQEEIIALGNSRKEHIQSLEQNKKKIREYENQNLYFEFEIPGVNKKISDYAENENSLHNQLSSAQTIDEQSRIQNQIVNVVTSRQYQENYLSELRGKINANKSKINQIEIENRGIEDIIRRLESQIQVKNDEKYRKENILIRMKAKFACLKDELVYLENVVRKFAGNALDSTEASITGVDQCIQYIEDYMKLNL